MGPKRKSSRRGSAVKMTGLDRDASIATNEYPFLLQMHDITDELQKRVEEAEAQLREEAKIIERMTRDNRSKQEQINQMEAMLQREIEKHQAAVRMLEDEALTQKLQAEHEIEVLRRRASQLELHVEAYDIVENSNHALRERVDRLMQQLEDENQAHAEEIHKVRLDMFNHKMALEKTFRKALQELDADYLKKAFNAMSEESKNALVANAKLKDELQMQSIGVDNLMQRFNQQAKHYQKMKIENDILEQESHLRLQEVASMKKAQLQGERAIEKLRDDAGREEQELKTNASKLIEELRKENQHLQKLHELAQKRCQKWKTRCLELADRETKRRLEEQRAQTAPTALPSDLLTLMRTQSQPVIRPKSHQEHRNFTEMWNTKLQPALGNRPETNDVPVTARPNTMELERLATASLDIRAQTPSVFTSRDSKELRKPHRLNTAVLPRPNQTIEFNFAR
ncbi:hypothetical protein Poli38472_008917 [Pythium oligandrum]|uniref:Cilia- and flagella-associated protein 157 n=1 Tax=Pythium oligandrum TaxID=41045 RepID=A0A8K1C4F6_PYTOL|nr:hypothetical protein Poli38472_008917 [Pythium oligandrum]|eukprot:TMW56269.1 hypothetical protein Poli38472_008917 [Pythium oligandrum]